MCGRYTLIAKNEKIKERFNVETPFVHKPRYNACPSQLMPVITNTSPNGLSLFYWGLTANFSNNKNVSRKLINARVESLTEKGFYKRTLESRRCIVPADGFYEWKHIGKKTSIPYRIALKSEGLFSFAGLWEEFENNPGEFVHTFTIITTNSYGGMETIHDRMPLILDQKTEKSWLDNNLATNEHMEILLNAGHHDLYIHPVSSLVNSPGNDFPSLITPTPPTNQYGNLTLFDF